MKQYLGKKCKVRILRDGTCLHFTACPVTDVSDTHLSFTDKLGEEMSFRIVDVVEINTCEGIDDEKEEDKTFK